MRNKIILAMAAAGMICATPAFAEATASTDAGGGIMTFSGSVINAPCSIAPDSQNIKVDLGQVPAKRLSAAGSTSDLTPVTITLTGCSFDPPPEEAQNGGVTGNMSKVAVSFPDAPAPEHGDGTLVNGEIKNTEVPGGAQHVAIQLLHGDGSTPVDMSKAPEAADAKNITLNTTASTNKLNFWARMISVAGKATTGAVGATVTYKLKYF